MRKRKETGLLMYEVCFSVMAKDASHAIKKIKDKKPTDVYINSAWKEGKLNQLESAIGYDDGIYEEDEED